MRTVRLCVGPYERQIATGVKGLQAANLQLSRLVYLMENC